MPSPMIGMKSRYLLLDRREDQQPDGGQHQADAVHHLGAAPAGEGDQREGDAEGDDVVPAVDEAGPRDGVLLALIGRREDGLGDGQRDELPVADHAVPLEQVDQGQLAQLGRHLDDRLDDLLQRRAEAALLRPQRGELLLRLGGISGVVSTETRTVPIEQTAPSMNDPTTQYGMPASVPPVDQLLEDEQRDVGERDAEAGEERLGQEALAQLGRRQLVGDERPVGLHRRVVAGVQQPQQQHGHPDRGDEREQEQADAAAEAPMRKNGLRRPHRGLHVRSERAPMNGWMRQTGDRSGQVEDRQVAGIGAEELVDRVHRGLLHPEAVLDAEEPEVHQQDLPHVHQRLLPDDRGVLQAGALLGRTHDMASCRPLLTRKSWSRVSSFSQPSPCQPATSGS